MKQLGTRVSNNTYAQKERLQTEGDFTVREILTLGIGMLYEATFGTMDRKALLERARELTAEQEGKNND